MINVYTISLGCPKNRVDTERLLGSINFRLRLVKHLKNAHIIFINTCGFIGPAVQESIRTILETAEAVKKLPHTKRPLLVVAGCLVGRYGKDTLANDLPEVDLWLEPEQLDSWPQLILQKIMTQKKITPVTPPYAGRLLSTGPSYAWLKISEGCDQKCSFCTIPSIRGKMRSLPALFILEESKRLLNQGVSELILVGQDITAWGKDLNGSKGLIELLEGLFNLPELKRLRLMYLYPSGVTDELLHFLQKAGPAFYPYFDIPIQHAHKDILSKMGRPFAKNPLKVIEKIKNCFPAAALRTSLITGFPGETTEHFSALHDFVEKVRFHNLGVFAYAAEEGTHAAKLPQQIDEELKLQRKNEIMELQAEISSEILADYVGEKMEILIDTPHPEWPGLYLGRTWFQAPEVDGSTYISGTDIRAGELLKAEITESFTYDLNALVD